MSVFCLSPDEVEPLSGKYWHHVERLERETGLVLASAIWRDLLCGDKQLWGVLKGSEVTGIVITEVFKTPKGESCLVYGACGQTTSAEINQVLSTIETWARNIGCTRLMYQGRKGWLRYLKEFRQTGVTAEKLL